MYDQKLTLHMLTTIMDGGGKNNEDFKYPLRSLKKKLDKKLLEIRHLPYHEADEAMASIVALSERRHCGLLLGPNWSLQFRSFPDGKQPCFFIYWLSTTKHKKRIQ